ESQELGSFRDLQEDAKMQRLRKALAMNCEPDLATTIRYAAETRDRYTLAYMHATGGIGVIWVAHDGDLGRNVALKELKPESAGNATSRARFITEARITGQLEHPGIVPVYELGKRTDDQKPFYTMRFVKGRTLTEAVKAYHERRTAGQASPLELNDLLNN